MRVFGDAPLDPAGRRRVLESADAVIFVADSHPLLVEDNCHFLEGLRAVLGPSDARAPVGLLVLANKQDRQRAVPPPRSRYASGSTPRRRSSDRSPRKAKGCCPRFASR
ncbi:MAG: hypothetical protein H6721_03210 [Sandaracinus sp.]|nr:hypothetical protein [Sandaracinus sp.]